MLNYFLFLFIFLITLFFYIHIVYHHKISNDLEIYDINNINSINLDDLLDLRQPISFQDSSYKPLNDIDIDELTSYFSAFDLNLWKIDSPNYLINVEPNIILMKDIIPTFQKNHNLICMQNQEFLKDSGLYNKINNSMNLLKPKLNSNIDIDLIIMSKNAYTPLQYKLGFRNYIIVNQGKLNIKLIPPKFNKYLHKEEDYLNFMFLSKINPWNVQNQYELDFNKVMTLDLTLEKNDIIYIPSYWYYSIQSTSNLSLFVNIQYGTYMNFISNSYHHFLHFLQKQNVKYDFLPKKHLSNDIIQNYINQNE